MTRWQAAGLPSIHLQAPGVTHAWSLRCAWVCRKDEEEHKRLLERLHAAKDTSRSGPSVVLVDAYNVGRGQMLS